MSVVTYSKARLFKKRVYYTGSDVLKEGYALCYDYDNENDYQNVTTADVDGSTWADSRRICVEKPSYANMCHFAGVVAEESANISAAGWITINLPGSVCNVYTSNNCDYGEGNVSTMPTLQTLNVRAGSYNMKEGGYPGSGAAIVLQDIDRSSTAGTVMAELQTGPPSGGLAYITALATAGANALSVNISSCWAAHGMFIIAGCSDVDAAVSVTLSTGNFAGQHVHVLLAEQVSGGIDINTASGGEWANVAAGVLSKENGFGDISVYLSAANEWFDATWNGKYWLCFTSYSVGMIS